MKTCINLREQFGKRFKIRYDESYYAENPKFRSQEEPWLQIIPCIGGEIYPHGGSRLAAFLRPGPRAKQLRALRCVEVHTAGSDGVTVLFDVADFDQVAQIMQPRKRRSPQYTPEQLEAKRQAMNRINQQRLQTHGAGQESPIGA